MTLGQKATAYATLLFLNVLFLVFTGPVVFIISLAFTLAAVGKIRKL